MPHSQSPHRSDSTDEPAALDTVESMGQSFCAPVPALSRLSISSSSRTPNGLPYTMASIYPESVPFEEQSYLPLDFMDVESATGSMLEWPIHYNFPVLPLRSAQEDASTGYSNSPQYNQDSTTSVSAATAFGYTSNGLPHPANYNLAFSSLEDDRNRPRSFASGLALDGSLGCIGITNSYPPSAYVIDPPRQHDAIEMSDQGSPAHIMQYRNDYESHCAPNIKVEGNIDCADPYKSRSSSRCSTPQGQYCLPRRDNKGATAGDEGSIDKDQPYAQLIYRALLAAPDHTMILRDIYKWFTDNTEKAADKETKGWQNSIRHNLSMNGVRIRKVDHPSEDPKKGFMWKLTDKAIREGVKSTTRYRSKMPNKRSQRAAHFPQPLRQASGAKGGHAARRSARMRRSQRGNDGCPRSDPYMSRITPTSYPMYDQQMYDGVDASYPRSPYYGSDLDFDIPPSHNGSPLLASGLDFDPYPSNQLSQGMTGGDIAYVLPSASPSDPLFYSTEDSPSPTSSEPRTPDSAGDLDLDIDHTPEDIYTWNNMGPTFHDGA